jgi:uncharacterized protein
LKNLLKSVIFDQQRLIWDKSYVRRDFPDTLLKSQEIIVISGIRRCGKSTLLNQIRSSSKEQQYYLNFDDDRLVNFHVEDFQILLEVFVELFGEQKHFWFDEIQNIHGWEWFIRRLYDYGYKIFLTGSNATMLSKELGTHLTGRYTRWEIYPFSFLEFLLFQGFSLSKDSFHSTTGKAELRRLFFDFFSSGGFPQFLKYHDENYLKSLFESILYRDVMARNNLTGGQELKELIYLLSSNVAKPYSNSRLAEAVGVKNATTIRNYLEFLQDTYLIFPVSKFDYSSRKQLQNPRKIYFIDNALIRKLGFQFSEDRGRLLENIIFLELRRRGLEIFYHKVKGECDFLLREGINVTGAIQVCYHFERKETLDREVKGLAEAMTIHRLDDGLILTDDTEVSIEKEGKKIRIMPAWKWLLE